MIQKIKKSEKDVLILDAGNLLFYNNVHPSLPASQKKEELLKAQVIIDAFNLMGCDAVGIGGDELRLGAKDFAKVTKKASFPLVSANVVGKKGRQISDSSIVQKAGGVRWGIFSLMSANPSAEAQHPNWKVLDPVTTGKQVVEELQDKVDIIILLAAMSLRELETLLPQVPGITIAVVGHNPSGLRRPLQIGGTIVVSSYGYGRYLGVLQLSIRDLEAPFVDEARIMELERALAIETGKTKGGASTEEIQTMETDLEELKQGNSYRNEHIMLSSKFREDRKVQKLIADFSAKQRQLRKGCD